MSASPEVSIVIPTYNRARYVREAVESALSQTFRDLEVIVVDDGSTDGTRGALGSLIDRVRYFRQENRGLAAARNTGIARARGRYVAFLDSDDRLEPRMVDEVLRTFREHPDAGAVFVAEREVDEDGRPTGRLHTKRTPGVRFSTAGMLSRDTGVGCGRPPVVRREWLEQLGGFDESFPSAVDCEMWIRYSFRVPMVLNPEPLVLRRTHPGHLSGDRALNARQWLRILDRLRREHPECVRAHPRVYRRALGKENLRLGRELLGRATGSPPTLAEARRALGRAVRAWPWFLRAWVYLAWAWTFPSTYGPWRRWERRRKL